LQGEKGKAVSLQPDICANRHGYEPNSFLANLRVAGRKQNLRQRIYVSLMEHGPATCEQLALRLGIRYTTCSARLSELKAMTWVVRSGQIRETTGGSDAAVVRALSAEEREKLLHPTRGYRPKQGKLFA
jgi:Mn-dependent DtxR family transcriptional regulator